jgi:hypothetical protein
VRTLVAIMIMVLMATSSAFARKTSVCTENSNPDVMMVKPAEDRV